MNESVKTGFSFGLTSGIITTLGLIIGLYSGTHSKTVVLAGILTIAIADSFSDALGIHISEESENNHTQKEIWQSTIATFLFKFFAALTFIVPVVFLRFSMAIAASIIWGVFVMSVLSYKIAKSQGEHPFKIAGEHLLIMAAVIATTHYAGKWISLLALNGN